MNFPFGSGTEVCFAICRRSGVSPGTAWGGNYLEEVPCNIGIRGGRRNAARLSRGFLREPSADVVVVDDGGGNKQ